MTIFPWQQTQWQQLKTQWQQKKLAHALLFSGKAGIGKQVFVTEFAKMLLCKSGEASCGACQSCHLLAAGHHPDLKIIAPEAGQSIKVDEIREVAKMMTEHSQYGAAKIALIFNADNMNMASSNALLKTLEEPRDNQFLFLVSSQPQQLIATVRSRCQLITLPAPDTDTAIKWLEQEKISQASLLLSLARGAPLAAQSLAENDSLNLRKQVFEQWCEFSRGHVSIVSLSETWIKSDLAFIMQQLFSWASDLVRLQQGSADILNQDFFDVLVKMSAHCDPSALQDFLDKWIKTQKLLMKPTAFNQQLLIEDLLIEWQRVLLTKTVRIS